LVSTHGAGVGECVIDISTAFFASPCASLTMTAAFSFAPSGITLPCQDAAQFIAVNAAGAARQRAPAQQPFFCTHAIIFSESSEHFPDASSGHARTSSQSSARAAAHDNEGYQPLILINLLVRASSRRHSEATHSDL
jgi:hypothetical protein